MYHSLIKMILVLALSLGLTLTSLIFLYHLGQELPLARAAGSRFVAPGGVNAGNDCSDSFNPCGSPQHAVDVAGAEDTINIAAGVYTGVNTYGGLAQVVYISKSLTLRGGYTPAFTAPPDPEANPTTLDAEALGRVLYITGNITVTIEGLHLTGGNFPESAGGGADIQAISVNFLNNVVFDNRASEGGGVSLAAITALVRGNRIISNTASGGMSLGLGGGLWVIGQALLENNIITDNAAIGGGGVLLVGGAEAFTFVGGAATLNQNIISHNSACYGGGLDLVFSTAVLSGNLVSHNLAQACPNDTGLGGGLVIDQQSDATLINNLIVDNQADIVGSGLYISGSSPQLIHNTIARNFGGDGSGIHSVDRFGVFNSISLTNTIIAGHTTGITAAPGTTTTLESTLWYGNADDWAGAGLIQTSNDYSGGPAFVDPDNGDYHLGPSSAALNRGLATDVATDIDGDLRSLGGAPDLGADEFSTYEGFIIPAFGGVVTPTLSVIIAAGPAAFSETIVIKYVPRPVRPVDPLKHVGLFYELSAVFASSGLPAQPQPGQHYTIVVSYRQEDVPADIDETDLALYSWNNGEWLKEATSVVNTEANTITATPNHFSLWAALAPASGQSSSGKVIFLPIILKN